MLVPGTQVLEPSSTASQGTHEQKIGSQAKQLGIGVHPVSGHRFCALKCFPSCFLLMCLGRQRRMWPNIWDPAIHVPDIISINFILLKALEVAAVNLHFLHSKNKIQRFRPKSINPKDCLILVFEHDWHMGRIHLNNYTLANNNTKQI